MINKRFASVVLLFFTSSGFAASALDVVLEKLAMVDSTTASFTETRTFSFLTDALTSQGTLRYKKPDYIQKQIVQPQAEMYEANQAYLKVTQADGKEQELLLQNYPVIEAFVNAYRGILSGNKAILLHHFEINFTGSLSGWQIKLKPKDEEAAQVVSAINFTGQQTRIVIITVLETSGDKSVMKITPK